MTVERFTPTLSSDEIWRGQDTSRCLSDDLDAMDAIHNALPNTYAAKNHSHSGYAASNHTHTEYVKTSDMQPKVLWSGSMYMGNGQTATLSEKVSEQLNGIVLVFSTYTNGAADNGSFNFMFVPKHFVANHNGGGVAFTLSNVDAGLMGHKYIYVNDDKLVGHTSNTNVGTVSGIDFKNNRFVLRYVLGC